MGQLLALESFEDAATEPEGPSADYNLGYAEGVAAAHASAEADAATAAQAMLQAISDIDFTYAEARMQILQSLTPLFDTLIKQVLPHCIETSFAQRISENLLHAASQDIDGPLKLYVHPDQYDAVTVLPSELLNKVTIHIDNSLTPQAAWIQHGRSETLLDLDTLLGHINAALGAISDISQESQNHG